MKKFSFRQMQHDAFSTVILQNSNFRFACSEKKLRNLTHLSLASLLWDLGKQNSPRCDATERGVPSGAILFAYRNFIEKWNKILNSLLTPLKLKVDPSD